VFSSECTQPPFGELPQLFSLMRGPRRSTGGFVIEFVAARSEDGTSTIAREFALCAATEFDRTVALLDLNWPDNPQFRFFAGEGILGSWRIGPDGFQPLETPLPEYEASRTLMPTDRGIVFHQFGNGNLVVSECPVAPGRHVYYPGGATELWGALRRSVDLVVIDAPAVARSLDGVMVAPATDAVVLVVTAEHTRISDALSLRNRILLQGANPVGVVFNRCQAPRFLQSVT
jgi:hypothetical protein